MIRVLIVDDSASLRAMITRALSIRDGIVVVGACADGADAPASAAALQPDVILMDLHMSKVSGIEATRALLALQPAAKVIIWTAASATRLILADAAAAGAVGYQLKTGHLDDLIIAVRAVAAGGTAWPQAASISTK